MIFGEKWYPIYGACKEFLAIQPTPIGEYLRLAYYRAVCKDISPEAKFLFGSMLARKDVTIGAGSVIGAYVIIGFARIGDNVLIGGQSSLISGKYQHGRPGEENDEDEPDGQYEIITIGSNTWIGQGVVIMVNIGEGCTVAAGSVVFKEVPDGITVMGNPARKVSM